MDLRVLQCLLNSYFAWKACWSAIAFVVLSWCNSFKLFSTRCPLCNGSRSSIIVYRPICVCLFSDNRMSQLSNFRHFWHSITQWALRVSGCRGSSRVPAKGVVGPADPVMVWKKRERRERNVPEESANNYADSSNLKHLKECEKRAV